VVGYIIIALLQIVQRKNFENRAIIGKDMDKSKVTLFMAHYVLLADRT